MTIAELRNALDDMEAEVGTDEAEIKTQTQASYPFINLIEGWTTSTAIKREEAEDDSALPHDDEETPIVYLVEGTQEGYGDAAAWDLATSF